MSTLKVSEYGQEMPQSQTNPRYHEEEAQKDSHTTARTLLKQSNQLSLPQRDDCLFVCFVALRPKSTAMVIAGRSVHLTILFPGQA